MLSLNDNPFAVLTAVVAPAILTNACSVLCLGTSSRIARVVDRTRVVSLSIAFYDQQLAFRSAAVVGLATGAFGVTGLVTGCFVMVRETRLALQNIAQEANLTPATNESGDRLPTI